MTTLGTTFANLLDDVATAMDSAGVTVPSVRYVHAGETAWDCEQFTLSFANITAQATRATPCPNIRTASAAFELVRCVPAWDGESAPDPSALDAFGQEMADAAVIMATSIVEALKDFGCTKVSFDGITVTGPIGGFVGLVGAFTIELAGIA